MESNIEIKVNGTSLTKYEKSGNIIGEIFLKSGEHCFPTSEWTDFIVVILSWWLESLTPFLHYQKGTKCELMFMDGPYSIILNREEDNLVELDFFARDKVVLQGRSYLNSLFESILEAAKTTLKEMDNRNWDTNDIRKLRSSVENFQLSLAK